MTVEEYLNECANPYCEKFDLRDPRVTVYLDRAVAEENQVVAKLQESEYEVMQSLENQRFIG